MNQLRTILLLGDILVATIAAGIAAAVTYIAHAAQFAAFFGGGRDEEDNSGSILGTVLLAGVAPIGATLVQLGISRSRDRIPRPISRG